MSRNQAAGMEGTAPRSGLVGRLAGIPRALPIAVLVPFALLLVPMLFAQPRPRTLLAPVWGPWAGLLYGHSDCTLGNQLPGASLGALGLGLGVVGLFLSPLGAVRGARIAGVVLGAAWAVVWGGLAGMSVLNTSF